jgi:hypothetical protein
LVEVKAQDCEAAQTTDTLVGAVAVASIENPASHASVPAEEMVVLDEVTTPSLTLPQKLGIAVHEPTTLLLESIHVPAEEQVTLTELELPV